MLMKVFPHGTGEGDKAQPLSCTPGLSGERHSPAPGAARRSSHDPRAYRQHRSAMEIHLRALSWHPDEKIGEAQEEEVTDAFEQVAFAGLEADQRNILWVRHTHAGHHELHFLIPRLELSSGRISTPALPAGKRLLMFSAISSTGAKAGRGRTIRRERGMNFQKGRPVQGAGWRDGAGKSGKVTATRPREGKSFMPFKARK